jgi:hypothetical protein
MACDQYAAFNVSGYWTVRRSQFGCINKALCTYDAAPMTQDKLKNQMEQ